MKASNDHGGGIFPSTQWTGVRLAGQPGEAEAQAALNGLLEAYRKPLLAHLRWRFIATEDQAEDWFHGFVAKKVLEKQLLPSARQERGRFRTFLLNALDNFVTDEIRREHRASRRPPGGFVSAEGVEEVPAASAAMPDPADVAWARTVLHQAITRLRDYYAAKGRADLWGVFNDGFAQPILNETEPPNMGELARRFEFRSASQASNGLGTAKQRFKHCMESVVAEYAEDPQTIEAELRDLMAILAGGK